MQRGSSGNESRQKKVDQYICEEVLRTKARSARALIALTALSGSLLLDSISFPGSFSLFFLTISCSEHFSLLLILLLLCIAIKGRHDLMVSLDDELHQELLSIMETILSFTHLILPLSLDI